MTVPLSSTAPTIGVLGDVSAGHHRSVRRVGLSAYVAALLFLRRTTAIHCKMYARPRSLTDQQSPNPLPCKGISLTNALPKPSAKVSVDLDGENPPAALPMPACEMEIPRIANPNHLIISGIPSILLRSQQAFLGTYIGCGSCALSA